MFEEHSSRVQLEVLLDQPDHLYKRIWRNSYIELSANCFIASLQPCSTTSIHREHMLVGEVEC